MVYSAAELQGYPFLARIRSCPYLEDERIAFSERRLFRDGRMPRAACGAARLAGKVTEAL